MKSGPNVKGPGRPQKKSPRKGLPNDSGLHVQIDTRGDLGLFQRVHGLARGLRDIDDPLVRANLELLPRLLVDVGRPIHRVTFDLRRKRYGTDDLRSGPFRRLDDLGRRSIENMMIVGFHSNSNFRRLHGRATSILVPAPPGGDTDLSRRDGDTASATRPEAVVTG